jgi:nucleoside phosphorylase
MRVLIVEDDQGKAASISKSVREGGLGIEEVTVAPDVMNARENLSHGGFDILLLDLQIPIRFGEKAIGSGGGEMLHWLARRVERQPDHIVAVTSYEVPGPTARLLNEWGVPVVHAEPSKEDWREFITGYIRRISRKAQTGSHERLVDEDVADCVVLTAVDVEHEHAVREYGVPRAPVLKGGVNWNVGTVSEAGRDLRVVVAQSNQMGMPAASVLAMKSIALWRPRLILMAGICAAVRNSANYGDLVVPDPCWDLGSGKLGEEGILHPDPRSIELRESIRSVLLSGKVSAPLAHWRDEWIAEKPDTVPKLHLMPGASGAAVLADGSTAAELKSHARKAVGIDMENYGFYYACSNCGISPQPAFFSVKSVVDFADPDKNDKFQNFGASLSAKFSKWVMLRYLNNRR